MVKDLLKGLAVTFRTMFEEPNTFEYPEHKKATAPRFHGRHILNRHDDGLERCIGCELCAYACPADAIYVQGADNTPEARYSVGERYASIYQINYNRCILCGLCIEACPTRALTMSNDYELASDSRAGLVYDKGRLLAPLPIGAVAPPHAMGADEPIPTIGRYGPHASVGQESAPREGTALRDREAQQSSRALPDDQAVPR